MTLWVPSRFSHWKMNTYGHSHVKIFILLDIGQAQSTGSFQHGLPTFLPLPIYVVGLAAPHGVMSRSQMRDDVY